MSPTTGSITIVVADDDVDDRLLIEEAFRENDMDGRVDFVEDGQELIDYLHREGPWAELSGRPQPSLILLDLNMPRMDGRQALKAIKADEDLCQIPVVIFSTSKAEEDISAAYKAGANSYVTKPVSFEGLLEIVRDLRHYWGSLTELPPEVA